MIKTGILIRAEIDDRWESVDIGDPKLSNEKLMGWLRSNGECNALAENTVGILLGRGHIVKEFEKKKGEQSGF